MRAAASLPEAVEAARAYRPARERHLQSLKNRGDELVDCTEWQQLAESNTKLS